jgi:DNA-binding XRE family transcriptional regulator
MDLSDKIKLILSRKNISPSIFADEIGVQRSSMSHILAGRNKPSLDIVQKIIKRFPDLGMSWIMDDQDLPNTLNDEFKKSDYQPEAPVRSAPNPTPAPEKIVEPEKPATATEVFQPNTVPPLPVKVVTKIVVFYSDGTFQELNPTAGF